MITETELNRILEKAEERFQKKLADVQSELDKLYNQIEDMKDSKKVTKTTTKS
jgi:hypothetical protein